MARFLISYLMVFCVVSAYPQQTDKEKERIPQETDSITLLDVYLEHLSYLVEWRDSLNRNATSAVAAPSPYYFKAVLTPTLYTSPLRQMMVDKDSTVTDFQLMRVSEMNNMLSRLYVQNPSLVTQTEETVRSQGLFRKDVKDKLETEDKLSDKVTASNLMPKLDEEVEVVTRRPNFWKFSGNASLQFTQNHFTDNWYQGGENNYSGNSNINLRLNFNNQKKITWDNSLEFQLGFQTSESDERRVFRPTSNRICFTTNFGYRAVNTLYYSGQVRIQTQVVPNYQPNTTVVTTDMFSPMDITIAPGLKYDIAYGKKKRFTGSLNIAPLAYSIRYCDRDLLVRNFGIDEGHHSVHTFGPNVTLNTTLTICSQIKWNSNIFWFSNLHSNKVEWTNTFNFTITKLISAQLYLYPRYDDSAVKFKNKNGKYFMFKEYFSMGLNYSF